MAKGTIRRLMDRGFGFIKTEDETDLFFHRNDIEGVEFGSLREGQEVEFEKGQGRDGRAAVLGVAQARRHRQGDLATVLDHGLGAKGHSARTLSGGGDRFSGECREHATAAGG